MIGCAVCHVALSYLCHGVCVLMCVCSSACVCVCVCVCVDVCVCWECGGGVCVCVCFCMFLFLNMLVVWTAQVSLGFITSPKSVPEVGTNLGIRSGR